MWIPMGAEHWECVFYELSFAHLNFMRAELCECVFYKSWAELTCVNVNLWDLRIANVNFMRVWALRMKILRELSIVNRIFMSAKLRSMNINFMRDELFKCELYESWALQKWIYESWALRMQIIWELSIANVNVMRAEYC